MVRPASSPDRHAPSLAPLRETGRTSVATEVRAAVALELARRGRRDRLDVVDGEVVVEVPTEGRSSGRTRVRARVTDEPVELQAERIVETVRAAEPGIAGPAGFDDSGTRAWCALD